MFILRFLVLTILIVVTLALKPIDDDMQERVYQLRDSLESKAKSTNNENLSKWLEKSSDGILVNWIINSENKLQKAEDDIIKHVKWRKDNDIDNVKNWKFSDQDELNLPFTVTGHDNNGDSVLFQPFGKWEVRRLLGEGMRTQKLINSYIRSFEWAMQTPDPATGLMPENFVYFADFEGFSIAQVTSIRSISVAVQFAITYMARFPMYAIRTVLFRDPPYFQVMWTACKAVIPERALKRMSLHGNDEKGWREAMNEYLTDDEIPDYLGGNAQINYVTHKNDNASS